MISTAPCDRKNSTQLGRDRSRPRASVPRRVGGTAGELGRMIRTVDPEIAIADISPLQRVVDKAVARRRELNILALGARTSQVFLLVLRQSAMPLAADIAAGCAGARAPSWR